MLRIAAVGLGLFLLFALLFVGGLGPRLFTYSAIASAVSLILAGFGLGGVEGRLFGLAVTVFAGLAYVPVVIQRFTWESGVDWGGLPFDAVYIACVACVAANYWFAAFRRSSPPGLRQ
jgi:hypothetical protein